MQAESKNLKESAEDPEEILAHRLIWISEIYSSLQGEGILTGTPSTFVRTSGCNLRCWFCDTRFASWNPQGEQLSIEMIRERCSQFDNRHTVLTGGEPMIYKQLPHLTEMLRALDQHITIETAGTVYQPVACDLMSISPKLASSKPLELSPKWQAAHEARRENLGIVASLLSEYPYQLKFVVDNQQDADEVLDYLERLTQIVAVDRDRILLMPQGTNQEHLTHQSEWLIPWCEEHGLRFCPRAHIEWYGNKRGT